MSVGKYFAVKKKDMQTQQKFNCKSYFLLHKEANYIKKKVSSLSEIKKVSITFLYVYYYILFKIFIR